MSFFSIIMNIYIRQYYNIFLKIFLMIASLPLIIYIVIYPNAPF